MNENYPEKTQFIELKPRVKTHAKHFALVALTEKNRKWFHIAAIGNLNENKKNYRRMKKTQFK